MSHVSLGVGWQQQALPGDKHVRMLAEPGWVKGHEFRQRGGVPTTLPDYLQAVAEVLRRAEAPALVFGGAARRASRQARELAERLGGSRDDGEREGSTA